MVFRLPSGALLQSGRDNQLLASKGLNRDRNAKLFRLQEVAVPQRALSPWPIRALLRTEHGHYLSMAGSTVGASAGAACCSEEFLVDLRAVAEQAGSRIQVSASNLWAGDAKRLVSGE